MNERKKNFLKPVLIVIGTCIAFIVLRAIIITVF